jgi:hypothetical protein
MEELINIIEKIDALKKRVDRLEETGMDCKIATISKSSFEQLNKLPILSSSPTKMA